MIHTPALSLYSPIQYGQGALLLLCWAYTHYFVGQLVLFTPAVSANQSLKIIYEGIRLTDCSLFTSIWMVLGISSDKLSLSPKRVSCVREQTNYREACTDTPEPFRQKVPRKPSPALGPLTQRERAVQSISLPQSIPGARQRALWALTPGHIV